MVIYILNISLDDGMSSQTSIVNHTDVQNVSFADGQASQDDKVSSCLINLKEIDIVRHFCKIV